MRTSRRAVLGAAVGALGTLAGCGGNGDGTPEPTATATDTATATPTATPSGPPADAPVRIVEVENKTFRPMVAAVEPGTVVEWRNVGIDRHHLEDAQFNADIAADWELDEPLVSDPVRHYFPDPGIYEYKCILDFGHKGGCGAVVVGDQAYDQSDLPCQPQ